MWHRFSGDLQKALYRALLAAEAAGARQVSTIHLLIGLMDAGVGLSAEILRRLGVSPDRLDLAGESEPESTGTDVGLTPAAREATEWAYAEAVALGDRNIGTEHFLFGLLRTPKSTAARVLDRNGVTLQTAAEALLAIEPHRYRLPEGVKPPNPDTLKANAARARAVQALNTAKRAAGAIPMLPKEPMLISFLARPIRIQHPHWYFRILRHRGFYRSDIVGGWMVSDYENVVRCLKEPALSAARYDWEVWSGYALPPLLDREFNRICGALNQQMIFQDAPEQTRLRSLVARQFTPRVLEGMRARIEETTNRLLDAAAAKRGPTDIIAELAFPLPATVIAQLLGVGDGDLDDFKQWSDDFVRFIGGRATLEEELRAYHSLTRLETYFGQAIKRARSTPKDDTLISLFVHAEDADGSRLTDEEIITNSMLILAAGHETTTHLIGNGLLLLLRHPDARKHLDANPDLWPTAIEEMLRFEPPVQFTSRVARQAFDLHGVRIQPGEWVNLALAAVNRDPARFPDPDRFDICRDDNKHVTFGSGPHYCLGASLARMEGAIALSTLLRRFPTLCLADRKPHWRDDFAFRAQTRLPVWLR